MLVAHLACLTRLLFFSTLLAQQGVFALLCLVPASHSSLFTAQHHVWPDLASLSASPASTTAAQLGGPHLRCMRLCRSPSDMSLKGPFRDPCKSSTEAGCPMQARLNIRDLLFGETAINRQADCAVARVMLHARDAALSQSMQDAASRAGPGQTVAGIVGDAHVQGICQHWHHSLEQQGSGGPSSHSSPDQQPSTKQGSESAAGASSALHSSSMGVAGGLGGNRQQEDVSLMGVRVALAESVLALQASIWCSDSRMLDAAAPHVVFTAVNCLLAEAGSC